MPAPSRPWAPWCMAPNTNTSADAEGSQADQVCMGRRRCRKAVQIGIVHADLHACKQALDVREPAEVGFMPLRLPPYHQATHVLLHLAVSYRCKQRLRAEEAPSRTRVVRIFCAKLTFDCAGLAAQ